MKTPPGTETLDVWGDNALVHEFRRPRWIILSLFVIVFVVATITLGFWQLRRLDERRAQNAVVESRLGRQPITLSDIDAALTPIDGNSVDPSELEFTPVTARGSFMEAGAIRVRSQVVNGQAGTHSVYALDVGDGSAVLVNVGWLPLEATPGPIADLYPNDVEITGLLRATQIRGSFGQTEPEGHLERVARIDIARIQRQIELPLLPYWIQLIEPNDPSRLPIPPAVPDLDEGSHLSYAIQWFSFALIAIGGYVALVRKELNRLRKRQKSDSQDPESPTHRVTDRKPRS